MGAGFRGFAVAMGYANLFSKAGLFTETESKIHSVGTGSSGSWWASQFFFSPQFYKKCLVHDPDEIKLFMIQWLGAWQRTMDEFAYDLFDRQWDSTVGEIISSHEVSLYHALENLFELSTDEYGDPDFVYRTASPDNKVPVLKNTDLLISLGLIPTSRTKNGLGRGLDSITYIGPSSDSSDSDNVYTGILPYQLVITNNDTLFVEGVEQRSLPLQTCTTKDPPRFFRINDWKNFGFFAENKNGNGNLLLSKSKIPSCVKQGILSKPFAGKYPTAIQSTLISSRIYTELTTLGPSSFSQVISSDLAAIAESNNSSWFQKKWDEMLLLSRANLMWLLADRKLERGMCLQHPNECSINDAFATHNIPDIHGLGMTIGNYQTKGDDDDDDDDVTTQTLKVFVCAHYADDRTPEALFGYFNTTYNAGVEPGAFLWPDYPNGGGNPTTPAPSVQIFDFYMDNSIFDSLMKEIPDSPVRWHRMSLTTIQNDAMRVKAGQPIDLLLLEVTGTGLPTIVQFGIEQYKEAYGDLAKNISSSLELLGIIQDFVA